MEKNVVFSTSGKGIWSKRKAKVRITGMSVVAGDSLSFGELRVYFNMDDWKTFAHGLIYTDPKFLKCLRKFLVAHNLPGQLVSYSEQGMQGFDYVSLDASGGFMRAWERKFGPPPEALADGCHPPWI